MPTLAEKALVVLHDKLARDTKKQGQDLSFQQIVGIIERRFEHLTAQGAARAAAAKDTAGPKKGGA